MPSARHDLCRTLARHLAPDRLGRRRGDRLEERPRHQGAGCLHGRHAAHDGQRHLRRQRHRARHRLADAPQPRRVLRPRPRQDPQLGQVPLLRPHHPLSRLLARLRVRRQGSGPRPHRPAPQAAGDHAAAGPGPRPGDDPQHLLPRDLLRPRRPGLADRVPPRPPARPEAHRRPGRCRHRPDAGRGRHQDDPAPAQEDRGAGHAGGLPLRRGAGRPLPEPRPDQRGDRPGPGRGGRRAHRRGHAQAGRGRDQRRSRCSTSTI